MTPETFLPLTLEVSLAGIPCRVRVVAYYRRHGDRGTPSWVLDRFTIDYAHARIFNTWQTLGSAGLYILERDHAAEITQAILRGNYAPRDPETAKDLA